MTQLNLTLLAITAASGLSAILTGAVWRASLKRQVLMDSPNSRSSHERPKPRGGGVGPVGGLVVGLVLISGAHSFERPTIILLLGTLVCATVGLWDDFRGMTVRQRLIAECAVAVFLVLETGPLGFFPLPAPLDFPLGPFGLIFAVVWLVGVTNFFNFMDGIDGLAGGQAILVSLLAAVAAWSPDSRSVGIVAAAAVMGFMPFNWWPSRIFLGDTGSLPLGFLIAGLPLLAPPSERPRAILATAMSLTLFLLDPVVTLWRRWRRGAALGEAHREHLYQSFLTPSDPHEPVTFAILGTGLVLSAFGWMQYRWPSLGWVGVAAASVAFGVEVLLARRTRHDDQPVDRHV